MANSYQGMDESETMDESGRNRNTTVRRGFFQSPSDESHRSIHPSTNHSATKLPLVIGIDLGTTHSAVAFVDPLGKPEMVRSEEGELTTPSVVYFDDRGAIVGREAQRAAEMNSMRAARHAKRFLGGRPFPVEIPNMRQRHGESGDSSRSNTARANDRVPPEVIQALVLKHLDRQVELRLGKVSSAVITVPAHFGEIERNATKVAGRLAGLDVVDLINEPTAAAIAHAYQRSCFESDITQTKIDSGMPARELGDHAGLMGDHANNSELVLVYDLGGGTFDATLMEIGPDRFDSIATTGDLYLGGVDWDNRVMHFLADRIRKHHGFEPRDDVAAVGVLMQKAEEIKKSLSFRTETLASIAWSGNTYPIKVERHELEAITKDLLFKTYELCRQLLEESGLFWSDLSRVLLVGGSSRMPAVSRMLGDNTEAFLDKTLSPDEAVAQGAALYAMQVRDDWRSGFETDTAANQQSSPMNFKTLPRGPCQPDIEWKRLSVSNVCSRDLGVLGWDESKKTYRWQTMLPRNSRLPATARKRFVTAVDDQRSVVVTVVESESGNNSKPQAIGSCRVANLPPGLPQGTCIQVTFRYSPEGLLSVDACLPDVGRQAQILIDRRTGIKPEEFEFWRDLIEMEMTLECCDTERICTTEERSVAKVDGLAEGSEKNRQGPFPGGPSPGGSESGGSESGGSESGGSESGGSESGGSESGGSETGGSETELDQLLQKLQTEPPSENEPQADAFGLSDLEEKGIHNNGNSTDSSAESDDLRDFFKSLKSSG